MDAVRIVLVLAALLSGVPDGPTSHGQACDRPDPPRIQVYEDGLAVLECRRRVLIRLHVPW